MGEQKRKEPTFYHSWHHPDKFDPGQHIQLERSVEFDSWQVNRSNLAELAKLPLKELQTKRKEAAASEKVTFERIQTSAEKWVEQAAQTMLLDRAIEYAKTPQVKHTSNKWKRREDGVWEISNHVYVMRYQISQMTEGNHKGQWLVTWGIAINCPARPSTEKHYYSGNTMVVEKKKKYYNAEADAQNYIQGRFDVYAYLFTELCPPIPSKFKRPFCINGVLLPGYTVAPKEKAPQEVADELLGLLEDGDIEPLPAPEPSIVPEESAPAQTRASPEPVPPRRAQGRKPSPAKKPAVKKKATAKKRSAPAR